MNEDNRATFEIWINAHRPETAQMIKSVEGQSMKEDVFIEKYKAIGLPRTAPAKGRGIYRFLVRVGFISN